MQKNLHERGFVGEEAVMGKTFHDERRARPSGLRPAEPGRGWWWAVMGKTFMMKTRAYPYGLCPPGTQARSGCVDALGVEGRKAGAGRMHTKNGPYFECKRLEFKSLGL